MAGLVSVLFGIGLLDSVSITPLATIPLLAALGSAKPLRASLALLAGIFLPYLAFGVVLLFGLSSLFDAVTERFEQILRHPDTLDMWLQLLIGAVALLAGARLARSRETADDRGAGEAVGAGSSFSIGVALTVVGLPGAVPYFAAIDQLLRADISAPTTLLLLGAYNVICALPLIGIIALRSILGERSDAAFARLADWVGRMGHRAIVITLVVLGVILLADGIGWLHGHPLIVV